MPAEIAIRVRPIGKNKGFEATIPLLKVTAHAKSEAGALSLCRQQAIDLLQRMIVEVSEYNTEINDDYPDELDGALEPELHDPTPDAPAKKPKRKIERAGPEQGFELSKPIPSLRGKYSITPDGTVYRTSNQRPRVTRDGCIVVRRNGLDASLKVSDLVKEVHGEK